MTDYITLQEAVREIEVLEQHTTWGLDKRRYVLIDRDEVRAILARVANEEPR